MLTWPPNSIDPKLIDHLLNKRPLPPTLRTHPTINVLLTDTTGHPQKTRVNSQMNQSCFRDTKETYTILGRWLYCCCFKKM